MATSFLFENLKWEAEIKKVLLLFPKGRALSAVEITS